MLYTENSSFFNQFKKFIGFLFLNALKHKQTNFLTVKNSNGRVLSDSKAFVDGARVSVNLKDRSATGKVKVSWRVVSEDGHPVSSFFTFTVKK
jgi:methionine-rich copper-binding protein CopC